MSRTASACITRSRLIRIAGIWGHDDPEAGKKYAADVKNLIDYATPGQIAGFIAESIQGVGGCVVFPDGYSQARLRARARRRRRLHRG